jgi:hypothetical protein
VIVGALIGGYLGKRLMYGMISLMVAGTCSAAVQFLLGNPMYTLIAFFVVLVIMWFLVEKFLAVITAFLGASMVGTSAMYGILFLFDMPFIGFVVFLIVTAALTYFGARYQLD